MSNQPRKRDKSKPASRKKAGSVVREREIGYITQPAKATSRVKFKKHTNRSDGLPSLPLDSYPAAYSPSHADITKTFSWLGMKGTAIQKLSSEFDYIEIGNSGITKTAINTLAEHIGISRKYISENIFDISVKTMERKDNKTKLDKKISSHAIEIAKVVQHAWQVFRDEAKVKRWLNRENRALNNKKPVELFDTLSGIVMVGDILGRIEEGVYS